MIPRIGVCVPTRDLTSADFTWSLAKMIGHFATHFVGEGQAEIVSLFDCGTLLPEMRNTLARHAIDMGCTHILWLDSDMTFPEDMIERLYGHGKPIIAASYSQRKDPAKPVAARDGKWLYTEEESTGIERVDYAGMGAMLVETAVYEHLDKPWHMLGWNEKRQTAIGEDVYFCRKAAAIGAETWIDHDLSKEIGHVGYRTFTYKDALEARPGLLAAQGGGKSAVDIHQPAKDEETV